MTDAIKHILVVEDNPAMAAVIRFNLQRSGFQVTVARDGREAWERARKHQFDLVLTDHQMPEMTGTELCRRLREDARYARTPVVLLTAKGLELELSRLHDELAVSATLAKPFSPARLVRTIKNCLALDAGPCETQASCVERLLPKQEGNTSRQ